MMKERIIIRKVTEADAQVLLDIYAPYVATPITFENEIPTVEEFARRIREIAAFYPYLVCEVEGRIVGYAYAHRQMERAAYQWNAELSVYIDAAFAGQGIGKQLYTRLIELLKQQHVKTLYALITLPNEASIALHRSFGFQEVGVWRQTGYKCGRWHDVMWMDLHIASMEGEPEALEPCRYME
jgi:L-amino acid N-acyltransferase YncA